MIKHGTRPFLECSSKGFKPFSAFYARIKARDNKTIEEIFQAAKVFENGETGLPINLAKGKKPINIDECVKLYSQLWDEYIEEHPMYITELKRWSGLSDCFGQPGHCCQATELWRIKQKYLHQGK